eukprot:CAMPEP_0173346318 /NCGR_PEP_ID=MMETSP1144-20121109/12498_1 /TAXON_ID=483371 /ORGANISM="non described non described, Strain CCMP2298" /LENGTH=182 /DNA_ID=CAMNT_0014293613 /DNA_START=342 /DNA_END=890 /DNA_ORIENTATION=-
MVDVELKDTLNKQWKESKSNFGFRMMQKMGWKEDKGLGKNESGIVDNVKISKRESGLGLGMEETVDGAGNRAWSDTANSFNAVLEVLKASYCVKKKSKKEKEGREGKEKRVKKSAPSISVGMKYKKLRAAKDMSTKTEADMRAIFGTGVFLLSALCPPLSPLFSLPHLHLPLYELQALHPQP